jgi:outer membrane beta-barrel protein
MIGKYMIKRSIITLLFLSNVAFAHEVPSVDAPEVKQTSPAKTAPKKKANKAKQAASDDTARSVVRVYQQIPLMKSGRIELGMTGGVSTNDQAFVHLNAGAAVRYHFTQQVSLGGTYHKYLRARTGLEESLTQDYGVFPERKFRDYYAGMDVAWAPLYGKMLALESAIVHFDVYLLGGGGVMRTFTQGGEGDNRISGNVGFGSRFYLGEWASINTEVRDYIYMETLQSGDTIHQDWVISLGLSMFIPTTYEYRYPK